MKKTKRASEYSLKEFMEMELPENAKLIKKELKDTYIGPFIEGYNMLSASYNVHFPELLPAFKKLDLIIASSKPKLVKRALRIDDITIENILENDAITALIDSEGVEQQMQVSSGEVKIVGNSDGSGGSMVKCHETMAINHDIWIPEFEQVFERLDKLVSAL